MELLKLAIKYYLNVTGSTCAEFYANLKDVVETDITTQTGDSWLRHKLIERVIEQGFDLGNILNCESNMMSYFEKKYESDIQEYSAETVWGKEVFKLLEKHEIDIEHTVFWDIFCLADTLFPTKINSKNVFLSHYNKQVVSSQKSKKGTLFQYDFLQDTTLDKLPIELKETIEQDKPLILLCCVPLRKGRVKSTVSDDMYADGFTKQHEDIYYQVLYKIRKFIETYHLTNIYVGFFGDTALFTESTNELFYKAFKTTLGFQDGFCFSLRDFNSTLLNVKSMHFSLWKAGTVIDKPVLLLKKRLVSKTKISDGETVLFEPNRTSLMDWLQPKDALFFEDAPMMLNYGTFKKAEKFEKVARVTNQNKKAQNAIGSLAITGKMEDIKKTMLLSALPWDNNFVNITEENFWRVVGVFAFSCIVTPTWNNGLMKISAPNTAVEGYDVWCKNALLTCFFDKKAQCSNIRNVEWNNTRYTVENKMFFVDAEFIKMSTHDTLIQQQIKVNNSNDFVVRMISEARPYWVDETRTLYEFCLDFVQRTLDKRKELRYPEDTDSWNAGFSQLRSVFADDVLFKSNFARLYSAYVTYLLKDMSKFGFLQDN